MLNEEVLPRKSMIDMQNSIATMKKAFCDMLPDSCLEHRFLTLIPPMLCCNIIWFARSLIYQPWIFLIPDTCGLIWLVFHMNETTLTLSTIPGSAIACLLSY